MVRKDSLKIKFPPMYPGALFMDEREVKAVTRVVRNKSLFRYYGPRQPKEVESFEKEFARYLGVSHVLGMSSGTGALYVAMAGIGVEPDDEVMVPAYTWLSTATAAVAHGARPVLVEIDETLTMDPGDLERKITSKTRLIIPVHMRGFPCNMDRIVKVAEANGVKVLEDCAQACGGSFHGRKLGTMGDAGIFSFQLNKVITAGEGGAVATSDEETYAKCVMAHDVAAAIGIGRVPLKTDEIVMGLNFRMSELHAAILREQLHKLDSIVSRMRRNKRLILEGIKDLPNLRLVESNDPEGDVGVCIVLLMDSVEDADLVEKALTEKGIRIWRLYKKGVPDGHVYTYWRGVAERFGFDENTCPRSLEVLGRTIHLDVNPLFTRRHLHYIISAIRETWRKVYR
ncbi:MAG: DegT/DnrJ/EryC1/StrS family aminotransferase [Thermoproteota archaeon]